MHQNRGAFRLEWLETRRLPSVGAGVFVPADLDADPDSQPQPLSLCGHSHVDGDAHHLLDPTAREAEAALNPNSTQVLFIDFDGATVTTNPCGFAYSTPYQVTAFDLSALGFGGQETLAEDYILQLVQEDFAAYDVTVTTTQPGSGPYSTIFIDDFSFEGGGILGVACYDPGNYSQNDFGFVFVRQFGSYASGRDLITFSQYLANTVSHETGHLFGLDHVTGANVMQPALNFNPFQIGFGSGSNQDSQAILAANLGYRDGVSDDFGDTAADASALSLNQPIDGLLERRDDVDSFTLVSNATQQVTLDIDTTQFGNLNSILTVKDANGTTLASNDDFGASQDSQLAFNATAGQAYTFFVSSAGEASSGTYTLHAITANGGSPAISVTEEVGTADDHALPFGAQVVGSASQHTFTIENNGSASLVIDGLRILGDGSFSLNTSSQPGDSSDDIQIAAGQSQSLTVSYTPSAAGDHLAQIQIVSNDDSQPTLTLDLSGSGGYPNAVITEADGSNNGQLDFGDVRAASESSVSVVTITNSGNAPMQVTLSLAHSSAFGFTGSSSLTVAAGASQDVSLGLRPDIPTSFTDILTIATDSPGLGATEVQLGGRGYLQLDRGDRFALERNGVDVTLALKGAGSARVFLDEAQSSITELDLFGTDSTTSVKIGGAVSLHEVASDGALKSFKAKQANLVDGSMEFGGSVGTLSLRSAVASAVHASSFGKIKLGADMIGSSLEADASNGFRGLGIGKLKVTGAYSDSIISVGVDADAIAAGLPALASSSSGAIGSITLGSVRTDNGGEEFGIFASGSIATVKVGFSKLPLPFVSDDFVVAVLS